MAGNATQGAVRIDVGGKSYRLKLTVNGMCELEGATGKTLIEVVEAMPKGSMNLLRSILWASLLEDHPDMSLADAGKIAQEIGVTSLAETLGEVIEAALPARDGDAAGKPKASAS